jgi:GNAT superfamily N-acetyltransferase
VKLNCLRHDDVEAALELSAQEDWNQTAADWSRLIRLAPQGCYAARSGGRVVGTVTTVAYGRALGWVGMMVVARDARRRGIGRALMEEALRHLRSASIATIKLDATPAGRPLYESLDFAAETGMERWDGVARHATDVDVREPDGPLLPALYRLDSAPFGADRAQLLSGLLGEPGNGALCSTSRNGDLTGYILMRPGRTSAYVGPLVATTTTAAVRLLDGALSRLRGRNVCLDVHVGGLLPVAVLEERGLTRRRGLTRMTFGVPSRAGTARRVCASAGPELG